MTDPADLQHRHERERVRADDLQDRDEFRGALVNSLQEGFFVADATGCVIEINAAFAEITGYGDEGLPYPMPHPWAVDEAVANERRRTLVRNGRITAESKIRHRDGRIRWVVISINAVSDPQSRSGLYVGTIRDVTGPRAAAERDRAVARLATAVSVAKSVDEVLGITLAQCRLPLDAQRLMAIMWPKAEGEQPTVRVAGEPAVAGWDDLSDDWRRTFEDARRWIPLTVTPVGGAPSAGTTRGFVAVLSGARDVVLCLEHRVPRVVSAEDRRLVSALVGHLSLAMQHVRQFETARETSLTLQRSLLAPTDLPAGFAVRYEPAVHPLEIGGDFYDVLPVGEGRIGLVVGDCVGRGLAAAAVMGQLRASTRALLLTGAQPSAVLEHLDSVAEFIPDAFCTTVFVAIIDTASATVHYSSAGHVPPVLVSDAAPPQLLGAAQSVPLAVRHPRPRPQATHQLAPGSTLMLYTDGLVERRHRPIDDQIDQLAAVVADSADLPIEEVADAVLRRLAPEQGYDDDVAIVLYRSPRAALVIDDAATAPKLTEVRHRLAAWLTANGVSDTAAADLVLVVNEACSNSIEHAYRGRDPGRMRVEAELHDAAVHVRVSDFGSWKAPAADPGTRGRGILLMRAVSDHVDLDGTPAGTTVEMTFALTP
ncbi:SpoIIE family protein phosphatase [Mycobacterium sp. E740]|uniref:SpoIIE family protein phosphatase n=1 Tax=Mycobacterium sp. E740 TaxID=1834149 RepID=UPI0007FEE639|nr:SpoIIE family protein phosphatase [Mycobacterium sp. E740]OBI74320.1 stage II sporulation protein E [Mycobacterium sp. E740]